MPFEIGNHHLVSFITATAEGNTQADAIEASFAGPICVKA